MIFELAQDFHNIVASMPEEHPKHRILELLEEAIRRDIHFIARHPTTLFQCMWNTCWWYDCSEAAKYYEEPEDGWTEVAPWNQHGSRIHRFLETWRIDREQMLPGFHWIRSLRPAPMSSGAGCLLVLKGHTCPVQCVDFSPDGQRLVSCSAHLNLNNVPLPQYIWHGGKRVSVAEPTKHPYPIVDNSVRIWDSRTGEELLCMSSDEGPVLNFSISPDGSSIVYTGSSYGSVQVVSSEDGKQKLSLFGHTAQVRGVAYSPDGEWIASASNDGTIRVREASKGADRCCLSGHKSSVMCVAFSPDGNLLASGSSSRSVPGHNSIRIWKVATGELLTCIDLPDLAGIPSLAFSRDNRTLVAACLDHRVLLFSLGDDNERILGFHKGEVSSVAFHPSGQYVVSGSTDRTIKVWDIHQGAELACLRGHLDVVNSVSFSPDGQFIVSGSADCTVRVWNTAYRTEYTQLHDHERDIVDLTFSSSDEFLVSASQDGSLRVWDTDGVQLKIRSDKPQVRKIIVSSDGRYAISADYNRIRLHNLQTEVTLVIVPKNLSTASTTSYSSVSESTLVNSKPGTLQIHEMPEGEKFSTYRCDDVEVTDFIITADGKQVIVGCWNGDLRIWQTEDCKQVECLECSDGKAEGLAFLAAENRMIYDHEVTCLTISRDGRWIASGAADGMVRLWDRIQLTGKGHHRHRFSVRSIAFSPDFTHVASGTDNGEIVVWMIPNSGLQSVSAFRQFHICESAVNQIAFSPDGKNIIAVCSEVTVCLDLASNRQEIISGRTEAVSFANNLLRETVQAMVLPLETAFIMPTTKDIVAWFPSPLTCLRAQSVGSLWAGAEVNHLCLLLVKKG